MKTLEPFRALALLPLLWLCSASPVSGPVRTVPFLTVDDPQTFGMMYNRRIAPLDVLFTSDVQYKRFFGHSAPGVDWTRERVVLYSAGQMSTGGFQATIRSIGFDPTTSELSITTLLEVPGPSCPVTLSLTTPYLLVKFRIPTTQPSTVAFTHLVVVEDCP